MAYLLWNLPCFGTSSTAPFEFFFSSFPPFPSFFIWFFLSFLLTSLSLLCQLLFLSLSSLPSSKPREEGRSKKEMCPLRLILIFLSATLAGFFVLKKLNNSYDDPHADPLTDDADPADADSDSDSRFSKVSSFSSYLHSLSIQDSHFFWATRWEWQWRLDFGRALTWQVAAISGTISVPIPTALPEFSYSLLILLSVTV